MEVDALAFSLEIEQHVCTYSHWYFIRYATACAQGSLPGFPGVPGCPRGPDNPGVPETPTK